MGQSEFPIAEYVGGDVDYVLNIEPYNFVRGKKFTAIWEIDLLLDRPEMKRENWQRADKIFTAISNVPDRLKGFDTEVLFQACDPELHKRIGIPEFDVVFCGSMDAAFYQERERVYNLIKDRFSFASFGKNKSISDYVECLSKARIQFIRSMKTPLADGELAQRFFECLAIGPVVTNYVPDLKLTGLEEFEHYYAYKDDEEMLRVVEYLLDNPHEVERVARNGRESALKNHTYKNRLEQIWKSIPKNI